MESQGITQTFNQSLMQSSISSAVHKANTLTSQGLAEKARVTINLMDVSFLEQNLSQILEVSQALFEYVHRLCKATRMLQFCAKTGGT